MIKIFELFDDGTRTLDLTGVGHPYIYLLMEYADMGTIMSCSQGSCSSYIRNEVFYNRISSLIEEKPSLTQGYSRKEEVARWIFR